jgi:nicotinamidase-related amidase
METNGNKLMVGLTGILIDMQPYFLKKIKSLSTKRKLMFSQIDMINYFRANDIPLAILEYEDKEGTIKEGTIRGLKDYIDELPEDRRTYFTKSDDSGFSNENLGKQLREWKTEDVILMGVNAHACVKGTAIGALDSGFNIITANELIADQYGPSDENRQISWYRQKGEYWTTHREITESDDSRYSWNDFLSLRLASRAKMREQIATYDAL